VRRVSIPELLDSDAGTAFEVQTALADLRRINRWFGGTSTTLALLERVISRSAPRQLSLLEVASGTAVLPNAAVEFARKHNVHLRVVCFDRCFTHLDTGVPAVVGDALHLPFATESFDLVSCGLFAHHLEPSEIVRFAREALRVAREALLINDLIRNAIHLAMAWVGRPLWRSRLTRHDSVASVRRSYTPAELGSLLQQAQPAKVEISQYYFFRFGAIAWKRHEK
jgi:hypothetical protein